MIYTKNCENISKFVKIRHRILQALFSGHGVQHSVGLHFVKAASINFLPRNILM